MYQSQKHILSKCCEAPMLALQTLVGKPTYTCTKCGKACVPIRDEGVDHD